jgi:hypothetical protein
MPFQISVLLVHLENVLFATGDGASRIIGNEKSCWRPALEEPR